MNRIARATLTALIGVSSPALAQATAPPPIELAAPPVAQVGVDPARGTDQVSGVEVGVRF